MKIADFERAIRNLDLGIHIDEICLEKGQVKELYAHTRHRYLRYTDLGMCFSIPSGVKNSTDVYKMSRQMFRVASGMERVRELDLRF